MVHGNVILVAQEASDWIFFRNHMDSQGSPNLRFCSPQPDTSSCCKTTDMVVVVVVVVYVDLYSTL